MTPAEQKLMDDIDAHLADATTSAADLRRLLEAPAVTTVTTAAELTMALAAGGTIQLLPGTYSGRFVVAVDGTTLLGVKVLDARVAAGETSAVSLQSSDPLLPALTITASHVTVEGMTFLQGARDRTVLLVGSPTATTAAAQPDGILLNAIEVVAPDATGGHRGIEAHTRNCTLMHSRVTGFWYAGGSAESQAFLAYNGPGPYTIWDCLLEGSGENVLFGGGKTMAPELLPGNVTIKGNTISKPAAWRSKAGTVKNSVELKACDGALIEDNIIDGCWKDKQDGHMIVLTPRASGSVPFVIVRNVIIRGNRSINHSAGYAVNVLLTDNLATSLQTENVTLERNLFQDSPKGVLISGGLVGQLRMTDNTLPGITGNLLTFDGNAATYVKPELIYDRNVAKSGAYGANGNSTSPGTPTLTAYTTLLSWTGNVIEKTAARTIPWPAGTTLLAPGGLASQLDADYHYIPGGAGW